MAMCRRFVLIYRRSECIFLRPAPTLVNTMRGDGAGSSTSSRSVIDTPAQQRTPLFIHLAFSLEMIRRVKPDFSGFFVLVL